LKITLTPQTSAARPGLVNILARFQVSGANPANGVNFQAAVPKVRRSVMPQVYHLYMLFVEY
jgi:AP-1 complex subunit gamma-1